MSVLITGILLTSCQNSPTPIPTPLATLTPVPVSTPTRGVPGSVDFPIILGLVGNTTDQSLNTSGEQISNFLAQGSGVQVEYRIFPNHTLLIHSMRQSDVHIAFLQPMTYLYAKSTESANVALMTKHFGLLSYGSQFFIRVNAGLVPYFDEQTQSNIAEPSAALPQLQGKRPCWNSPQSVSGFLIPAAILFQNGIQIQEPVFSQSFTASIRALYITGICDFGGAYAISGDPRTADGVITDLTDVMERVQVLWRSNAIIPNMNISIHPGISEEIDRSLVTSFLVLAKTEQGRAWLFQATQYQMDDLVIVDDTFYDGLRAVLEGFDYDPVTFIGY